MANDNQRKIKGFFFGYLRFWQSCLLSLLVGLGHESTLAQ